MDDTGTMAEATHPPGIIVEIVGIEKGNRGRCVRSTMCVGRWWRRILCCASGGSKFWWMGKRRPASPAIG
jgi:hypothetical protein